MTTNKKTLEIQVNSSPRFVLFGIAGRSSWPLVSPLVSPSSLLLRCLALPFFPFSLFHSQEPFSWITTWDLTARNTSLANFKRLFLIRILGGSEARVLVGGGLTTMSTRCRCYRFLIFRLQILLLSPRSIVIFSATDRNNEKASHAFAVHQLLISIEQFTL